MKQAEEALKEKGIHSEKLSVRKMQAELKSLYGSKINNNKVVVYVREAKQRAIDKPTNEVVVRERDGG